MAMVPTARPAIADANGKRLLLDSYVPAAGGEQRRPAVVMIHGGGWRIGDKDWWAEEAQLLAGRGWVGFSVNYRLDEPSPFPAAIDDTQAAVRWVRLRRRAPHRHAGHRGERAPGPGLLGAAAVAVLGAAGSVVLRRRRLLRGDKATDSRPV